MIKKSIQIVPGFTWFGKNIGLKDSALDFGGVLSDTVCNAAGVFTQNTMPGAPVLVGKEHLSDGLLQAIIVNSKYANVATRTQGLEDAITICRLVADDCGIQTIVQYSVDLSKMQILFDQGVGRAQNRCRDA